MRGPVLLRWVLPGVVLGHIGANWWPATSLSCMAFGLLAAVYGLVSGPQMRRGTLGAVFMGVALGIMGAEWGRRDRGAPIEAGEDAVVQLDVTQVWPRAGRQYRAVGVLQSGTPL
ncbi:MAG: hypothetical protein L7S63_06420, partial [Flavobacteriales bacterium]|nr:hypothetical protein [Flavobacteriales bacterium]